MTKIEYMLHEEPKKVTYAQQTLLELIKNRELRKWCLENGLSHTLIYKLAMGQSPISYKTMCSLCYLISPIDWLYFTDEEKPYPDKKVPEWNPNESCKFIVENKYNYRLIADNFGMTHEIAKNIFMTHRTKPSPTLIRQLADAEVCDPIEFFISSESIEEIEYTPYVGDIVSYQGYSYLIVSINDYKEKKYCYMCKIISDKDIDNDVCISLKQNITTKELSEKYINPFDITTFVFSPKRLSFIESTTEDVIQKALSHIRGLF